MATLRAQLARKPSIDCGGDGVGLRIRNIGALTIRTGFWGSLYYNYVKDPPPQKKGNYISPYSTEGVGLVRVEASNAVKSGGEVVVDTDRHCSCVSLLSCLPLKDPTNIEKTTHELLQASHKN